MELKKKQLIGQSGEIISGETHEGVAKIERVRKKPDMTHKWKALFINKLSFT